MPTLTVTVPTPDGECDATLHLPAAGATHPGVILYPDAAGVRDTFQTMAERLADLGHVVLLPNVYYRAGDIAPFDIATVFVDPDERARMFALVGG